MTHHTLLLCSGGGGGGEEENRIQVGEKTPHGHEKEISKNFWVFVSTSFSRLFYCNGFNKKKT